MLYNAFPDLQWLKKTAEGRFAAKKAWNGEVLPTHGWPNVILNVKSGSIYRDNIPGPLSLFSNVSGQSMVAVNGRTTVVGPDHFFITNNSQRYTLTIDESKSAETFNIHFADNWLPGEFYNKLYRKDEVVIKIQKELSASDKTRLEREELLAYLIGYLTRLNQKEKLKLDNLDAAKASTREEILRRLHIASDYIYSYYSSDLSLEELSKVSMLSKFHFLRAFRQAFGSSPHRFVNSVRLEKAKELLKNSDLEVVDIGKAVGIWDGSSFSRMFKKEVGVYPTVFRSF